MVSEVLIPSGFRASGVKAGIKHSGLLDLAVLAACSKYSAAGRLTHNRVVAAPVDWGPRGRSPVTVRHRGAVDDGQTRLIIEPQLEQPRFDGGNAPERSQAAGRTLA